MSPLVKDSLFGIPRRAKLPQVSCCLDEAADCPAFEPFLAWGRVYTTHWTNSAIGGFKSRVRMTQTIESGRADASISQSPELKTAPMGCQGQGIISRAHGFCEVIRASAANDRLSLGKAAGQCRPIEVPAARARVVCLRCKRSETPKGDCECDACCVTRKRFHQMMLPSHQPAATRRTHRPSNRRRGVAWR